MRHILHLSKLVRSLGLTLLVLILHYITKFSTFLWAKATCYSFFSSTQSQLFAVHRLCKGISCVYYVIPWDCLHVPRSPLSFSDWTTSAPEVIGETWLALLTFMVKRIWEDAFKFANHLSVKIFPMHWFWRVVWAKVTNVLKSVIVLRHAYQLVENPCIQRGVGRSDDFLACNQIL